MNPRHFKHISIFAFAAVLFIVSASSLLQWPIAIGLGLAALALPTVLLILDPDLRRSHHRVIGRPGAIALPFGGAVLAALAAGLPGVWSMVAGAVLAVASVIVLSRVWPFIDESDKGARAPA
jgi:hypothetical protein